MSGWWKCAQSAASTAFHGDRTFDARLLRRCALAAKAALRQLSVGSAREIIWLAIIHPPGQRRVAWRTALGGQSPSSRQDDTLGRGDEHSPSLRAPDKCV